MSVRNQMPDNTPGSPDELNRRYPSAYVVPTTSQTVQGLVAASFPTITGDGSTDEYAGLNTLANTTIPTTGGSLHFSEGTYRCNASLTIPANVASTFAKGAKVKPASGVAIRFNGPVSAGLYQIFDLSLGGTVRFGSGSQMEVRPEWWGAIGDGDSANATTNTEALNDSLSAISVSGQQFTPTNGVATQVAPLLVLTGRYKIDGELNVPGFCNIDFRDSASIEQTNAKRRIFVNTTDCFMWRIKRPKLVNGTRQIDLGNPNTDTTTVEIEAPEFQGSSDYAIHTVGTSGWASPTVSTTLTGAADAGDAALSVTSESGFAADDPIALQNDRGEYHVSHIVSTSSGSIVIREPIPAHWTGSGETASIGNAVKTGDFHLSTLFKVGGVTKFMTPRRCVFNVCDYMHIDDAWVFLSNTNADASRAFFVNWNEGTASSQIGSHLFFNRMIGVPAMGTEGVDRLSAVRWIDNYGNLFAHQSRFGGEFGGMPPVYQFGRVQTTYPFQGSQVVLRDCSLAMGPAAATDSCVVNLQTHVPALIDITGSNFMVDSPLIRNGASLDLDTYFDALSDRGDRYKIQLEPNMSGGAVTTIPAQLKPFIAYADKFRQGTAAPTVGWWVAGQRVENSAPAVVPDGASDYVITGWICTAAGEPGTWVEMRTLTGT